ncbi:MAG TPA: hypothetical protein VGA11_00820 [Acidimicrobiia bacterium]
MSERKIHPVRGVFAGLVLGLGAAVIMVSTSVIAFGTNAPLVVVGAGAVFGGLWGGFAPARAR